MTPSDIPILPGQCECGHPKATHFPHCIATTYVFGPNSGSATSCKCKRFKPPLLVGKHPKRAGEDTVALHD